MIIDNIFLNCTLNIDCAGLLEPHYQGRSNEYPQSLFLSRNKKNNVHVYLFNPLFPSISLYCFKVNRWETFRSVTNYISAVISNNVGTNRFNIQWFVTILLCEELQTIYCEVKGCKTLYKVVIMALVVI